jgi:hypothetical protein
MTTFLAAAYANALNANLALGTQVDAGDRFIGLLTSVGPGTEVVGGDYARVDATTVMGTAAGGSSDNTTAVDFAAAGPACTVTGVAMYDDAGAGNLLAKADMVPTTFAAADPISIPIGLLVAAITGAP